MHNQRLIEFVRGLPEKPRQPFLLLHVGRPMLSTVLWPAPVPASVPYFEGSVDFFATSTCPFMPNAE